MDLIAQAWHDAFIAPDDREIYDWGADFIDLPKGGYAISGGFVIDKCRQLIEPFQALHNIHTAMVSVRAAIQGQKSLLGDIWFPNVLANNSGPMLMTMQTDQIAHEHARVRLWPVMENCKPLRRFLPNKTPLTFKQVLFKGNIPLYVRGPALGNAQSKSIRYLWIDEAWLLAHERGRINEFLARTTAYDIIGNSKTLITSQGGDLVRDQEQNIIGDDWAKLWHKGDQSWWEVHCLHCKHRFIPHWTIELGMKNGEPDRAGMKWDANGGQVRYECPNCRQAMIDTDATKAEWNAHGRYKVLNPSVTSHRSFTWPAWISSAWQPLVDEFLAAMQAKRAGYIVPLKIFLQKKAGVDWEERKQLESDEAQITTIDIEADKAWPDEKYRFMTIDCQANLLLFYYVIRAWGNNGESRRLARGQALSFEELRKIQEQFKVKSRFVGIDCGYEATRVYRQCCRFIEADGKGWAAFKETDREYFNHQIKSKFEQRIYSTQQLGDPILGWGREDTRAWLQTVSPQALRLYQAGQLKCRVYMWSRPSANDILQNLLDGRGASFTAPASEAGEEEERIYRQHLAAEARRFKPDKHGVPRSLWMQLSPNNHYRSCEKIQVVMGTLAGVINPEKMIFTTAE